MIPGIRHIYTKKAPEPGAYSQGVMPDPHYYQTLYLAGQTGNDPDLPDQRVVSGDVGHQTFRALMNLIAVVEAAGGDASSFVKLNVYLKDPGSEEQRQADWHKYNDAYQGFFASQGITHKMEMPARKQLWVSDVPWATEETIVEIDGIAAIPRQK